MNDGSVSYAELARVFLRLSVTAFGGPVAHIALAEDELVTRRRWLTRDHYLDLIAAANLIPGPNSTEVMIHVGHSLRGIPGALVSGLCFIGPAFLITLALSFFYVNSGALPEVEALFRGIQPVIVAVIAGAGWRLLRSALQGEKLWLLFAFSAALLAATELPEVLVMLLAGLLHVTWQSRAAMATPAFLLTGLPAIPGQLLLAAGTPGLGELFLYFLRIGAILFGSGYLLVAYIQQDLVVSYGWLGPQQLLDAIAIGQTTPGPVLTTSTAIGTIVAGLPGALLATLGIFLPSFIFVMLSAPFIPRLRQSAPVRHFLAGVHAAVVAAILVTLLGLARTALSDSAGQPWLPGLALCALSLIALVRWQVNATWLVLIGGVAGLLMNSAGL
ncbi:MAG: chromate efflux transporter [Anaerolineaceae bacterium]|nr:chromate efflux transporter [Anaerolineaceae bacterium]